MKKYQVSADFIEFLLSKNIEAENKDEAKEKYIELWEDGEILCNTSQITNFKIEEI